MHSVSLEMEKSVTWQGDLSRGQRDPGNTVKKATKQANITAIKNMLEFKIPKESILKKYTESEYNTAIAELQSESR